MNQKNKWSCFRLAVGFLFLICTAFMHYSCNHAKEDKFKGYQNIKVVLDSNIGSVSIKLPPEFDTSYKCLEYSDCGYCCASIHHCYASKIDQTVFEDTIHDFQPKVKSQIRRFYSFAVIQSMGMNCTGNRKKEMSEEDLKIIVESLRMQEKTILFSKIDTIQGRNFLVFATVYPKEDGFEEELCARTYIGYEPICFRFYKTVNDKKGFIQRMYDCLMTLEIVDNQK